MVRLFDSLYIRIGFAITVILVTAVALSGYGISVQIERQLHEQILDKAGFTAQSIEQALTPLLDGQNLGQTQKLIETIGAYRFIHKICLLDRQYDVIASSDLFSIGKQKKIPIVRDVFEKGILHKTSDTDDYFYSAYPVRSRFYLSKSETDISHVLYIELKKDFQYQIMSTLKRSLFFMIMLLLVVNTVSGLFFVYMMIMRPLGQFRDTLGQAAKVDYEKGIVIQRRDELGRIMQYFNHMINLLSQRNRNLAQSRERLNLALDAGEAGLWDWNILTGEITYNERLAAMLGYDAGHVQNNIGFWAGLMHPDDKERAWRFFVDHFKNRSDTHQIEYRMKCRDNSWRWVLSTGRVILWGDNGKAARAIGTHVDIQNKKEIERELKEYRNHLETIVRKRTDELEQVQDELLNRAIDSGRAQLSAMILHNIGNAVTPVSVQLELLEKKSIANTARYIDKCFKELMDHKDHFADYVTKNSRGVSLAELMVNLIEHLHTHQGETETIIKKISLSMKYMSDVLSIQGTYAASGRDGIKETINLNTVIDDAMKMMSTGLEKYQIRVEKKFDRKLPGIVIEKNKLVQVLVNIIKNSREAIEENKTRQDHCIEIVTLKKNSKARIEIKDTGCGITEKQLEQIFEFGVSSKGSSGFGLYYCKNFVEINKGELTIDSPGKNMGTMVTLEFPVPDKINQKAKHGY